jgi:SAM-dependent methyltransferase
MTWGGIRAVVLRRREHELPSSLVADAVARHGAQQWFLYAHARWSQRGHVWWPSLWLARHLRQSSAILETGCGCGLNLLWFAQLGYRHLYGCDIDDTAIRAGRELFGKRGASAHLWLDDCLSPRRLPPMRFDAILALNWTYHAAEFDLARFLPVYRAHLHSAGYLAMDFVDSEYDTVRNSRYLTSDWSKPEGERRPTEYHKRYSEATITECAKAHGFRVVRHQRLVDKTSSVPRRIAILAPCR